jgi:hypothetical protein
MVIQNFSGTLICAPGAVFRMSDNSKGGMWFYQGSRTRVVGLRCTYATTPTVRVDPSVCVAFEDITEPYVERVEAVGSPGYGVYFGGAIRGIIRGVRVNGTMADGLNLTNCQSCIVDGAHIDSSGDDGIGMLSFVGGTQSTNLMFSNLMINNAGSRGIAVVGPAYVSVDGFQIYNTAVEGVISQLNDVGTFHVSEHVVFRNGKIFAAGANSGVGVGNEWGMEFIQVGNVTVENVEIFSPVARGFDAWLDQTRTLRISNVHINDAREMGFRIGNIGRLYMYDSQVDGCNHTGFYFYDCGLIHYRNLVARNTSKTDTNRRALFFWQTNDPAATADMRVNGDDFTIRDDQATPTGYRLNSDLSSGTLTGSVGRVRYQVENALPADPLTGGFGHLTFSLDFLAKEVSADRGNNSVTLTMSDSPVQRFATTLTANRTVTLPTTAVYNGAKFRIVRTGLGAFTLDVGGLKTIPSGTAAYVDVTHDGTAWRLSGYGTL